MIKARVKFKNELDKYLKKISRENDMSILSEQCGPEQHIMMALFTWVRQENSSNIKKLEKISKEIKNKFVGVKFSQIRDRNFYNTYGDVDYGCSLEIHVLLPL